MAQRITVKVKESQSSRPFFEGGFRQFCRNFLGLFDNFCRFVFPAFPFNSPFCGQGWGISSQNGVHKSLARFVLGL